MILTVTILVSSYLMDGIHVNVFFSAFFAVAILGIFNAFFRPISLVFDTPDKYP
jgi:uncharacterized membrane protein YvlD (DUF360 family)